ncbi:hypothetical protein XNC1_2205 [Xenorhabdus nematophila ATCC 19061]|uniref:Uncharacterized protein n=1 Tax=Xenorhabdus nematophila (strain ATCC 19061 / DSM 3370 / CCUG 14189 / LMG 1036 / NCIMB 9965 / AN6) TaxID=406817 RepID=D3VFF0_XENNA|nr:hypothetical protein XNC1_2205 [Xenorhabdus nematophila ATCC 19061]CEE93271.1 hypothetical protein XNA1_3550024 [Xenorhabdus nematophila str. Anatoliense]CEE96069.1 hypothetical protein XNA1_950024 [Xenorhabdus nematophila str. Anatoliense]
MLHQLLAIMTSIESAKRYFSLYSNKLTDKLFKVIACIINQLIA